MICGLDSLLRTFMQHENIVVSVDAEKWAFVAETKTVEVECGTKKQLSQRLKVVVRDRFGNPAECPSGLKPSISLDSLSER